MRFLAFQICFFSILFTAKAEKNLLATYNKEIWPFNYSIQDSIKNAVVYYSNIQVVTNTGVLVLDKANQHYFTQSSDRLHRFYPSFLDVNYLDKSLFYMLMGNAYLDNNLSIDSYFSNCTLIQSDMDRCYVVQHDSLYLVSNLARYFIYYPVKKLYRIKNKIYLWIKSGTLFEMEHSTTNKLFSFSSKYPAPCQIKQVKKGILLLFDSPFGIAYISNKYLQWIIPLSGKHRLKSTTVFDSKLFLLFDDGLIQYVEYTPKMNFTLNTLTSTNGLKPQALTLDNKNRLVIVYADYLELYTKKKQISINKSDIQTVFNTKNGFVSLSNEGKLRWKNGTRIDKRNTYTSIPFQFIQNDTKSAVFINEKGIYYLDKKTTCLASFSHLISSHFRSVYGSFWIYHDRKFEFININNNQVDTSQFFLYNSSVPQKIETDKAGNLWFIQNDSVLFYSARLLKLLPVISLNKKAVTHLYNGSNYLLLQIDNNFYRCSFDGNLTKLLWEGSIALFSNIKVVDIHENTSNEWVAVCSTSTDEKKIFVFKLSIINDVIYSSVLAEYKSQKKVKEMYVKLPVITLFTSDEAITLNTNSFYYPIEKIEFFNYNKSPLYNNCINEFRNHEPSSICFQYSDLDKSKNGFYQIKLEPNDTAWINYSSSQVYSFPNLKKGIYKLNVRYCTNDGHVLAKSTLLINLKEYSWFQKKYLVVYSILFIALLLLFIHLFYRIKIYYKLKVEKLISQRTSIINEEKHKLQKLLEAFVPREATNEIMATGKATYQRFDGVSVLFTDIQGFSMIAEATDPEILIEQLDDLFYRFDFIVGKYDIEKIKTIGDAYMAAGGLPTKRSSNAVEMILAAMEMLDYVKHLTMQLDFDWKIRVGIHTGKIIAGVIGQKKLSYDIWGDTVNVANRMESSSVAGRINISGETYKLVKDFFDCEYRGRIPIKNRGEIDMYFVNEIHPWLTENRKPNKEFALLIQLICLNDLAEVVLAKIDEEMPSNRYFHTSEYIHTLYSNSITVGKQIALTSENQLVLQTACLLLHYGMIEHYDNYVNESINFTQTILPEYKYNSTQIDLICKTLEAVNSLKPTTLIEVLLLEMLYSCWGTCEFPEQLRALYIEESEMLGHLSWKEWITLKITQFEHVLRYIDVDRVGFEINPTTQIQKLRAIKI